MVYTFYSYKGGVGRSMALVNIAELMYRAGLRVLMVDWDLEAPGLERYYKSQIETVTQHRGLIDMLWQYKKRVSQETVSGETIIEPLDSYVVNLYADQDGDGQLWLLPAGQRTDLGEYANRVKSFDWGEFYQEWKGELYFELLRKEMEQFADVILIDSRTGVTEMGGVCTYQLADVVLLFCAPNEANIEGTLSMLNILHSSELQEMRADRPLKTLVVPSRVETTAELDQRNEFHQKLKKEFDDFITLEIKNPDDLFWDIEIPYIPKYAFEERIAVNQDDDWYHKELVQSYRNLFDNIVVFQSKSPLSFKPSIDFKFQDQVERYHFVVNTTSPLLLIELASEKRYTLFSINLKTLKETWLYPLQSKIVSNIVQVDENIAFCCRDGFHFLDIKTGARIYYENLALVRRYFLATDELKQICFIASDRLYKYQNNLLIETPYPTPDDAKLIANTPILLIEKYLVFGTKNTKTKDGYLLFWNIEEEQFYFEVFINTKIEIIYPAPNNHIIIQARTILDGQNTLTLWDINSNSQKASLSINSIHVILDKDELYIITSDKTLVVCSTITLREKKVIQLPLDMDITISPIRINNYFCLIMNSNELILFDIFNEEVINSYLLDYKINHLANWRQFVYLSGDNRIDRFRLTKER